MRKLLLFALLFSAFSVFTQNKWSAKDLIKIEDAEIYLEITDYNSALDIFLSLYEKFGSAKDMDLKIGLCYYSLGNKTEAKGYFEKSCKLETANACFYLALIYHEEEMFDEAIHQFQIFKNMEGRKSFDNYEADRRIESAERAKVMMANPVKAIVYNLGESVNSSFDDYGPLITADETMMAFTSRREGTTGDKKDPYGEYLEDIYVAFKIDDRWDEVKNIGPPLNSKTHDAAVGLSSDGNSMIIYRTNKDLTAGDLYLSHYENNSWSEPEMLNEAINTEYQEASASLTNDQRTIYFSSNRPGGLGEKDIYRVVKITDEIWSLPLNLGPTINTAYDEDAPFIHADGKTLYFSSKGHSTMGGYDVFRTYLSEEYWSIPENIGYPANTVKDDIFFVLAADGKRGYYSTELPDGYGGHDVYAVSFEDAIESLRIVKGNIKNKNGDALSARIDLLNEKGESFGIYNTNSITGNYIIILPPNENFILTVSADGYSDIEEKIHYQGGTIIKEKVQNFTLINSLEQ